MADKTPEPRPLDALIRDYCVTMRSEWTDATKTKTATDLGRFLRWLDENDLPATVESLDPATVGRYKLDLTERPAMRDGWRGRGGRVTPDVRTTDPLKQMSTNTVTSYMSPLRSFCAWLVEEEELARNPFSAGKRKVRLKTVQGELKAATRDELARLEAGTKGADALTLRDRAIYQVLRWTAIRARELCSIKLDDIDPQNGTLHVRDGKGRIARTVPLPEGAIPDLLRYLRRGRPRLIAKHRVRGFEDLPKRDPGWLFLGRLNGAGDGDQKLHPNTIGQILTDAFRRAGGIGPSGPHGLRHFRAAELVAGGMPIATLMLILGHKNITTTQRYLRSLAIEDLSDATRRADEANQIRRAA